MSKPKFKMSEEQVLENGRLLVALRSAGNDVNSAIDAFNVEVKEAFTKLTSIVDNYNEAVRAANSCGESIAEAAEEALNELGEKAQDGVSGEKLNEFMDLHREELEEMVIDEPEELEYPEPETPDQFEERAQRC